MPTRCAKQSTTKTLKVRSQCGEHLTTIKPSEFLGWRKKWADDTGRAPRRVGLVVDTPGGEALVTSAAALRRLLASLPPGERAAGVVALCSLPAQLQAKLTGCEVWKAV